MGSIYNYELPTNTGLDWLIKERNTEKYCRQIEKYGCGQSKIPPNVFKKIIRLIDADVLNNREIADETAVHKNTIANIKRRHAQQNFLSFRPGKNPRPEGNKPRK